MTDKLTAGIYDSQITDHKAPLGPARYQKDWALNAHYNFNEYVYGKLEQHFVEGTQLGYDATLNPATAQLPTGLHPNTALTILKIGVSF